MLQIMQRRIHNHYPSRQNTVVSVITFGTGNAFGQRVFQIVTHGTSANSTTTTTIATRFVYDEAGCLIGEYDSSGVMKQENMWMNELPIAVIKAAPITTPMPTIASCYTPFATNERLEVRSGKPDAADWEWGLGANTQVSSQFGNINNIDWTSRGFR